MFSKTISVLESDRTRAWRTSVFFPPATPRSWWSFGAEIDRGLSNRVLSLSERVRQAKIPGVTETVPTFRSLAVHYDPLVTSAEPLVAVIREFLAGAAEPQHCARLWRVPACYEEHCAPDLAEVARAKDT